MSKNYESPILIAEDEDLSVDHAAAADAGAVITAIALIAAAVYTKDCSTAEAQAQ